MTTELANDIRNPRPEMRNVILAMLISLYGIVLIRTAWVDDYAYGTFRTIVNFMANQGLVYNPGERVQVFSHPLWLFFLAVIDNYYHDFYYASLGISIVISIAAVIILARWVSVSTISATIGISILVLSRAFVDYSTSGLENPLSHLLVILFLVLYFSKTPTVRRLFFLSLVAELGTLNRLDAILLFLPALIYSFWKIRSKQAIIAVVLGFLPMIIWEAFSLFYYGFPFPNTFYTKLNTGIPVAEMSQQGLFYLYNSINTDPLTMIAIIGGITVALLDRNLCHILIALGIFLYLMYVVGIGGDYMAGRFLTIPLVAAVGIIVNRPMGARAEYFIILGVVAILGLTVPYPTLTSGDNYGAGWQSYVDRWGISDARAEYYQGAGLLSTKRYLDMPNNALVQKGLEIQRSGQTIYETDSIGFTGFYAGRGVHIIDTRGLADPLLARLNPASKVYWTMAEFTRSVPAGYAETISSGKNEIANKDLAEYYDKLSLVVSGRLTDPRRLLEIWKLNFGYYDPLIKAYEDSILLHVSLSDINHPGLS